MIGKRTIISQALGEVCPFLLSVQGLYCYISQSRIKRNDKTVG